MKLSVTKRKKPLGSSKPKKFSVKSEPKNLPFLEENGTSIRLKKPIPPSNQHLIEKEKELDAELAGKLKPSVSRIQEFYLDHAATMLLSLDIGTDESVSVLERVLDSPVNMLGVRQLLESLLHEALNLKALRCAIEVMGLDAQEANMLKALYFLKATGGSVKGQDEKILSELLKILAVPGQEEGSSSHLRQARKNEGSQGHTRTDRDPPPSGKGKKGRRG